MAGTELDVIIRSIRENGHRLFNKLFKRYSLLEHKPDLAAKIVAIVVDAFSGAGPVGGTL